MASHAVTTTRLDDITEISDIDFIKIDVQGSELVVFQNASRVLSSAVLIQTEVEFVELYRGQPMFAEDWMRLEDLSEAKLRNYAILAHDVLRSYDLAHLVLSTLDGKTGGRHAADYMGRLVGSGSPS